jgi:hypothetical protein
MVGGVEEGTDAIPVPENNVEPVNDPDSVEAQAEGEEVDSKGSFSLEPNPTQEPATAPATAPAERNEAPPTNIPELFQMNLQFGQSTSQEIAFGAKTPVLATAGSGDSLGFEVESNIPDITKIPEETKEPNTAELISTQESDGEFVNSETGNYYTHPLFPQLFGCQDPVSCVTHELTHLNM